jgi:hypothetical protein
MMEQLSSLLYRITGRGRLRGYESACLDGWLQEIPPDLAVIARGQLERLKLVQRLSDDMVTGFFEHPRVGKPPWPEDLLFEHRGLAVPVAEVVLTGKGDAGKRALVCTIFTHRGRLARLEFTKRPESVFPTRIEASDVEVAAVEILRDIGASEEAPIGEVVSAALPSWARELGAREIKPPLTPRRRSVLLERLNTKLPDGYLELLGVCDGFRVGDAFVFGLEGQMFVSLPDGVYVVIASSEAKGHLAVRRDAKDSSIFFIDNETPDCALLVGLPFEEAFKSVQVQ